MRSLALLSILALGLGGCVTKSTTTEDDRQVNHQILDGATVCLDLLIAIEQRTVQLDEAQAIVSDIKANAATLEEVHGPPEKPLPYDKANSEAARAASKKSHIAWWMGIAGTALVALTYLSKVMKSPTIRLLTNVPMIGPYIKFAASSVEGIERICAKLTAEGKPGIASAIKTELQLAHQDANVEAYAAPFLKKAEVKLGKIAETISSGTTTPA